VTIYRNGLGTPVSISINDVKNQLPETSLCWKDLVHLNKDDLDRRVHAVADALGAPKIIAKISCGDFTTMRNTLAEWWEAAESIELWTILTTAKRVGSLPPSHEGLEDKLRDRLHEGSNPFRAFNPDYQVDSEEDTNQEEDLRQGEGVKLDWV
jgi:hypothetical protein